MCNLFVIYFVLLSFYGVAFFIAIKLKNKDHHDFFKNLAAVLAVALFLIPLLFFDNWWKCVAVPSCSVILSTIYLEDDLSKSGTNSNSVSNSDGAS